METLCQDIRYAVSSMRRRPGTPLLALLTIALGVGAATAMYSVVDGVLLRPLPFDGADRLMSVYPTIEDWRTNPVLASDADRGAFSYPEYEEWRAKQTAFERVAAIGGGSATMLGAGEPTRISLSSATVDLFPMLNIEPVLGRLFVAEDWSADGGPIVLTNGMWRAQFGGATDIIGKTVRLDGNQRTIIGVLPETFHELGLTAEAWSLLGGPAEEKQRLNHSLRAVGLLKPGTKREYATSETSQIMQTLSRASGHDITHHATVVPRLDDQTRDVKKPLLLLLAATGVLLLAACINVAGLLLGSGIDRSAELAVRSALGAGRARITRQLMTESLVLAVVGGVAGIAVAFVGKKLLLMMAPANLPRAGLVGIDMRVLAFALACSCGVGLLFGLVPAISLSRTRLTDRMGSARVTSSRRARLHAGLVTIQLALAMLLLGSAGLLVHTLTALNRVDPGFDARNLLAVDLSLPWAEFRDKTALEKQIYYDGLVDAIRRAPGVEDIALTSFLPFSGDRASNTVEPEGYTPAEGEILDATRHYVSGNYFPLMKMRVTEGRALNESDDRAGAVQVAVVGRRFASHFWPGQKALGKRFKTWDGNFTVVGVVDDPKDRSLEENEVLRYFVPIKRQEQVLGAGILVRTKGDPSRVAPAVRTAIWGIDRNLPITRTESMSSMISESMVAQRYRARLIGSFAVLALLFSLLGVYGVVNRAVSGRMREMGLRLALGARPHSLVLMVLAHGMRLSVFGVAIGLLGLTAVTRVMTAFLFGTRALDPVALGVVAFILVGLTALAVLPPSLRASRAVALEALRAPD